jgi:AcrR family transcriptional regulator
MLSNAAVEPAPAGARVVAGKRPTDRKRPADGVRRSNDARRSNGMPEANGKGARKRLATERGLIEAFGRIVRRKGLRHVGVNEVLKEAGVGKAVLYRYFGGLPGLVEAWGRLNRIWPQQAHLAPLADEADGAASLKRIVRRNAEVHRADPVRIEMLADELMTPTALSGALTGIRRQLGQEHAAAFAGHRLFQQHRDLMIVAMAAASFLAMRAVKAPRYMGQDLADEATWRRLMARIDRVIDQAMREETGERRRGK